MWTRRLLDVIGMTTLFFGAVWMQPCVDNCKVAICISGQVSRWMPTYFFDNVVHANQNHDLHLFWNLQINSARSPIHSSGVAFQPTEESTWDRKRTEKALANFTGASTHVNIASLTYYGPEDSNHWVNVTGGALDRFTQRNMHHGTGIIVNIMNMYHAHVMCANQIRAYEEQQQIFHAASWRFEYIMATREDTYFFSALNISDLATHLRPDPSSAASNQARCDLVMKDCLNWGGFNMRLFMYNRAAGLTMLGERFNFFHTMRLGGWKVPNPETLEALQADNFALIGCALPVDAVPVTVARHVANGTVCFYEIELKGCVPDSAVEHMKQQLRCEDVERSQ